MHYPSTRAPLGPGNVSHEGIGGSSNAMPMANSAAGPYPSVSVSSTMNCGTEVNAITEELRSAVEQCQVMNK